jgi:predicted DNA-binding transcriptional regulator AlpA
MKQTNAEAVLAARRQVPSETAAEFLGVSLRKMEKMRREGDGPRFVRLSSKLVRYRICDLIEFQEQHLQANNAGLSAA